MFSHNLSGSSQSSTHCQSKGKSNGTGKPQAKDKAQDTDRARSKSRPPKPDPVANSDVFISHCCDYGLNAECKRANCPYGHLTEEELVTQIRAEEARRLASASALASQTRRTSLAIPSGDHQGGSPGSRLQYYPGCVLVQLRLPSMTVLPLRAHGLPLKTCSRS